MVFAGSEGPPIGENSVANEFIHDAVMLEDDFCHGGQVFVQQRDQFDGVRLLGDGGEIAYVGKKDGQLALLARQINLFQVIQHIAHELRRNVVANSVKACAPHQIRTAN